MKISIDDFGTGYSSLGRLRTLPVDELKIDKSFVDELASPGAHTPIVAAVCAMVRAVGLEVVAEGVETTEQLAALRRLRCDRLQGFLFSRPLPPDELKELLAFPKPFPTLVAAPGTAAAGDVEQETMDVVSAALLSSGDLESLVRPLLVELERLTGLESTYLTRIDWERAEQEVLFARNAGSLVVPESLVVDWGDTLCRRALSGGPMMTDDVPSVYPDSEAAKALGLQSFASVPVTTDNGIVFGTLCGASGERRTIDAQTRSVMELFGHLINDRLSSGSLLPNPGAPVIRVVIVDDSEVTRRLLRAVLDSDERFEVVAEATDGECAVATAQSHCPDLLLMDLNMPGMDGYTALPKVQAVCPQAKVVILSANSSEGHQEQLSALGAAAVLEKDRPFSEILSAAARVVAPPTASPSVA